jgi:hypothetical protein
MPASPTNPAVFTFKFATNWRASTTEPVSKYPLVCSVLLNGVFTDFPARLTPKTLVLVATSGGLSRKHVYKKEANRFAEEGRLANHGYSAGVEVSIVSEGLGPNTSPELRTLLEGLGGAFFEEKRVSDLIRASNKRRANLEEVAVTSAAALLNAIASGEEVDLEALATEFRTASAAVVSVGYPEDVPVETSRISVRGLYFAKSH